MPRGRTVPLLAGGKVQAIDPLERRKDLLREIRLRTVRSQASGKIQEIGRREPGKANGRTEAERTADWDDRGRLGPVP